VKNSRIIGQEQVFFQPKEVNMPQAGLHGLVGMAVRKLVGKKEWLVLGLILGSFVPDMDNIGVAIATLAKMPTEGIHRTMTHSVFFMAAVVAIFYLVSRWKKETRWLNLGLGLGLGMLLHSLLDFVLWFNGVDLFWPLGGEINFWANSNPPAWFMIFLEQASEFLFFGLFLWVLGIWARKYSTDAEFMGKQRMWMWLEFALFAIFTAGLIFGKEYKTISGALYLFSLFMTFFVTIRMRKTVEAAVG
jgi:membrane-bound metal-dependent hydrolase YbcI (DUF457 family)